MSHSKHVHVVGTGTIGEPLIGLLSDFRQELGIGTVSFHKRTPLTNERAKVRNLLNRGALLCTDKESIPKFEQQGLKVSWEVEDAIREAAVVIDCTPSGVGHANKQQYYERHKDSTLGFVAQGSEFGFGKMYARGVNDSVLQRGKDKFIQVVSCNTHNVAVLLNTIALQKGDPGNLVEGKFLLMRRASDISQDEDFIPAPKVGKHDDPEFGTHHARDAYHLFETLGYKLNIFSSAIKLPTQYMHCLWFSIKIREKITLKQLIDRFKENDRIALTEKKSANQIFSFGRDHGHYGRILSQTVVVTPTLQVRETDGGSEVIGFSFTPQDGNSLLSSVAIASWFMYPDEYEKRIQCLKQFFFEEI
jgi:glyceraldehyde-3-phosphate dehydrogenase (NAD(P))